MMLCDRSKGRGKKTLSNNVFFHAPKLTVGSLAFAVLMGCNSETTDSEAIATSSIWADMEIEASASRSRVNVELNAGGTFGTNLELSQGEYLEVTVDGVSTRLEKDQDFLDVDYQAYVDTVSEDTEFGVTYYRNSGETLTGSSVTLPAPFTITSPESGELLSLSDTLEVLWGTPADGTLFLSATSTCQLAAGGTTVETFIQSRETGDDGEYTTVISELPIFTQGFDQYSREAVCNITLTLKRSSSGTVDAAFHASSEITASQARSVDFKLDISES